MPPAVGKWAASTVTDTAVRSPDGDEEEEEREDNGEEEEEEVSAAMAAAEAGEPAASPLDEETPRLPSPPSFRLNRVAAHTASCSRR